ncbi:hypothetical protein VPH35_033814 [Triticum aestivum]
MASLQLQAAAAVLALVAGAGAAHSFVFHEATVDAIQLGFSNDTLTSTALVRFYLDQIGRLNPLLHAVIEVNPDALRHAKHADADRRSSGNATGSLHGVPVLLKDNIATRDALNMTASSFALLGSVVRRDTGVVARLRAPAPWCSARPACLSGPASTKSTTGGAPAAARRGTQMDGYKLCPSSFNSVVGINPTLGLTSRAGVVPITLLQDTVGVGPMCQTVLDAIVGYDPHDAAATGAASKYIPRGGSAQFLKKDGLMGKRIGVLNGFFQGYRQPRLNTESPCLLLERMKDFGQSNLIAAEDTNGIGPVEGAAIGRLKELNTDGLEKLMKEHQLVAILAPNDDASSLLAIGGNPCIVVPVGYDEQGVPFGICFGGLKVYEPRLIEMAYAFEQATKDKQSRLTGRNGDKNETRSWLGSDYEKISSDPKMMGAIEDKNRENMRDIAYSNSARKITQSDGTSSIRESSCKVDPDLARRSIYMAEK